MLREPFAQTVSMYNRMLRDLRRGVWVHPGFDRGDTDFEAMLVDERSMHFANSQARFLRVDPDIRRLLRERNVDVRSFKFIGFEPFALPSLSDTQLLAAAEDHLSQCAFFGLQSFFEESLLLLADTFGWPVHERIERKNVSIGSSGRRIFRRQCGGGWKSSTRSISRSTPQQSKSFCGSTVRCC